MDEFLISNFRRVLNAVCFLLSNSPASEVNMPTLTLSVPPSQAGGRVYNSAHTYLPMKVGQQSVPKCRHINFRRQGITQKGAYNKNG
jgi:hypothetical protein